MGRTRSPSGICEKTPSVPTLQACVRGKKHTVRKLVGRSRRSPQAFGDLATVDHVHTRGRMDRAGVGGIVDSFTALEGKERVQVLRTGLETTRAPQYMAG